MDPCFPKEYQIGESVPEGSVKVNMGKQAKYIKIHYTASMRNKRTHLMVAVIWAMTMLLSNMEQSW